MMARRKAAVAEQLDSLAGMTRAQLEASWQAAYATPAPRLSPELLRLGIAWRLQEQVMGSIRPDDP